MLPPIPSRYTYGTTVPLYESNQIEFKVSTISFDKLKKTVCAFLNTIGGYIFIGIDDSRQICGIDPKMADNITLMVDQLICLKSITHMDGKELTIKEASVQIVDVMGNGDRVILIIKVQPISLSEDYMWNTGECYFRLNASNYCRRSDACEIIQLRAEVAKLKNDKLKLNGYINMLSGTLRRSLAAAAKSPLDGLFRWLIGDCLIGPELSDNNDLHHVGAGYLSTTYK